MAMEFASLLGAEVELVVFDAAGKSVEAVVAEQADIGFFAIDPVRGADIAFTAPYVLIEGFYLVRTDSTLRSNEEIEKLRTEAARRLLESAHYSIQIVARRTGFGDHERLRRAFVKVYGVSPQDYRARFGRGQG